jgi:2-keto-4-pentenoate hydratase/2-oxohepta-3-ene-1,7-dioic acid hydratase in catechol pathway
VPSKIVCVGRNYVEHAAEHGVDVPERPLLFLKAPSALVGPGEAVILPAASQQVEHEAEVALVIGRRGRHIAEAGAWEHVLGVTCANDVTARDLQRADGQWTRGKGFDTFCPLGPWIVTNLGEAEAADLEISCRVNGEPRQRARSSQMVFSPSFLVAYISGIMTLEPGDLILTGTPSGVSRLHPGDEVEVVIAGVGRLSNPVAG